MRRISFTRGWMLAALLTVTGFSVPGPCSFEDHPELDCGRLDDQRTDCTQTDDCASLPGDGWRCLDEVCVKDCAEGKFCDGDGFCKPTTTACKAGETTCDSHCIDADLVESHPELCCGGCTGDERCCRNGAGDNTPGCVDLQSKLTHCGACDNSCWQGGCYDGVCGECASNAECATLRPFDTTPICCDHLCIDAVDHGAHCGSCDNVCSDDGEWFFCHDGECRDRSSDEFCGYFGYDCLSMNQICWETSAGNFDCGACDVFDPSLACPDGYECMAQLGSGTSGTCLQRDGSNLAPYAACPFPSDSNACQAGYTCASYVLGGTTYCLKPCRPDGDDCASGEACHEFGNSNIGTGFCLPSCPCPSATVSAAAGFDSCHIRVVDDSCTAVCGPGGSATTTCAINGNHCSDGKTCQVLGIGSNWLCAEPCSSSSPCASGSCAHTDICPNDVGYCTP